MAMKIFKIMKLFVSTSIMILLISVVSGCAQKVPPKFLRNREYDYARAQVIQPPMIKIPSSVDKPDYNPMYTMPKGRIFTRRFLAKKIQRFCPLQHYYPQNRNDLWVKHPAKKRACIEKY